MACVGYRSYCYTPDLSLVSADSDCLACSGDLGFTGSTFTESEVTF